MVKIFVYGSLCTGMYNYEHYLKGKVKHTRRAYVKGELYQIQGVRYPALLAKEAYVAGELMEICDDGIISTLDALEEYIGPEHPDNLYDKKVCTIYNEAKEEIAEVPVYFYNVRKPSQKNCLGPRIEEQDFVSFYHHVYGGRERM